MAVNAKITDHAFSVPEITRAEFNKLVADVTAIRTALITALQQLDGDGGVTLTTYEANATPAALTATTVTGI